jgi:8-oxo-dGTP pyrophosphatase MutT (NUDIX family)
MANRRVIYKIGLAVFKDKKVLLTREAKNEHAFYMLGGKADEGESEVETLRREVMEEIGCEVVVESLKFLHEFEAPAYGKKDIVVNERIYTGQIIGEPKPLSEIAEIRYFDSSIEPKRLTPVSVMYMDWFKQNGYID